MQGTCTCILYMVGEYVYGKWMMYMYPYMQTHIHINMGLYMFRCANVYANAYVSVAEKSQCRGKLICAGVCECVCVCVHVYAYAYADSYVCVCVCV